MRIRFKHIVSDDPEEFEKKLNEFVGEKVFTYMEIRYCSTEGHYSALIDYQLNEKNNIPVVKIDKP